MIYELASPHGTTTHIRITLLRYAPSSGAVVHFQPGRMVDGVFAPDSLLGELERQLTKAEMDAVRAAAAEAGAPITAGEQEWRFADLLPAVG